MTPNDLRHDLADSAPTQTVCARCSGRSTPERLIDRAGLERYLALSPEKVQWIIDTRQLLVVRLRGEERFDLRDLDQLVELYKNTAKRRNG